MLKYTRGISLRFHPHDPSFENSFMREYIEAINTVDRYLYINLQVQCQISVKDCPSIKRDQRIVTNRNRKLLILK